ncbi:AAA family ATPase [Leifsonia shinshuensis]|uniref:AAA family ATPase n=1 Tax=Leifsonia shinshuensis TaxID=150026 RepID=UPI001F50C6C0|nr:AAA family ATPase [Leifsonia shinshuensis]MCI0155422.1 AAA family ATPase [Leifsonia shinshuensis]
MDCVFINGTVGAGKSTLADALSAAEPLPHAVIDLDAIRRLSPSPHGDPFNHELELQNLRALATNYRAAGAQRFILAGVIEVPGETARYLEALGASGLLICRLTARPDILAARLRARHRDDPADLEWHLGRVGELTAILDRFEGHDLVLDSADAAPGDLVRAVRVAAGWEG